jgi:polar amino acid transport system substrate-binding protein
MKSFSLYFHILFFLPINLEFSNEKFWPEWNTASGHFLDEEDGILQGTSTIEFENIPPHKKPPLGARNLPSKDPVGHPENTEAIEKNTKKEGPSKDQISKKNISIGTKPEIPSPYPNPEENKKSKKKKELKKFTIAISSDYPPYSYIDSENKLKGFYSDLLEEMKKRLKGEFELELKAMPFIKAMELGELGLLGIIGVYKNEEREKNYDFSDYIFEETVSVYVQKGKGFQFTGLKDLKGKYLALVNGYSYGSLFDKAKARKWFQYQLANSDWEALEFLMQGKVHCALVDDIIANRLIFKEGINLKLEKLNLPATVNKTYLIWPKKSQEKELIDIFNKTLTILQVDGTYSRMISNFIRSTFVD